MVLRTFNPKVIIRVIFVLVLIVSLFLSSVRIIPKASAATTTYTISDGSMTAATASGACAGGLTNSTPTDGGQGTVMSTLCSAKNKTIIVKWTKTLTWETMGVPAGATITQVDGNYKYRQAQETNNTTQTMGALQLRDSGDTASCAASDPEASFDPTPTNGSYTSRNASGNVNVNSGSCSASATSMTIRIDMSANTPNTNGSTTELRSDDIQLVITYNLPVFTQAAYRLFNNADSTNVSSALAAANTAATLGSSDAIFRLRMLVSVSTAGLIINGQNFKLQFAGKGAGTCASPSGTPSSYTDVTTTTAIAYYNNSTPTDGSALTSNANDPTDGGNTIRNQTYEEANNFINSQAAVATSEDGKWDFALTDYTAPSSTAYCFRIVQSDGTALTTYTNYPQITTAAGTLTTDIVDSGGSSVSSPSVSFGGITVGNTCQTSTGTLGASSQKVRVTNNTTNAAWSLSIAATSGATSNWSSGTATYDFNDPTSSGCSDGGDADSLAGQLSIDPSGASDTPKSNCVTTGVSLGSSSAFNQGTTDNITLSSASSSAGTRCYWDFTGISLSQKVPAFQPAGSYSMNFTMTVVAN